MTAGKTGVTFDLPPAKEKEVSASEASKGEDNGEHASPPKSAPLASSKANVVVDGKLSAEEKSRLAGMLGNANAQDTRAFIKQVQCVQRKLSGWDDGGL